MKGNSTEKNINNPKPPCKGYDSYDILLDAVRRGLTSAEECLGRLCLTQIIPSLKRNRVSDSEAEDAAIIALSQFIQKLRHNTNNLTINIGLLWFMAKSRLIDMIRKRKNDIDIPIIEELLDDLPDDTSFDGIEEEKVYYYIELFKKFYLTDRERTVFILFYEQNLSIAEIVKETGFSQAEVYRLKGSIDKEKKAKFGDDLREEKI